MAYFEHLERAARFSFTKSHVDRFVTSKWKVGASDRQRVKLVK